MFYAECIDIPGVHIFSKKSYEGGNNEPDKYKNWTIKRSHERTGNRCIPGSDCGFS